MTSVLLFAKAPRRGRVKTRLAREIGSARAVAVYRALGSQVAAAVRSRYPVTVWYEPDDARAEMREWLGALEYQPQVRGDLGVRMRHAFAMHFERGDRPVVIVGADAPGVDATVIAEAEAALRSVDVVFGPALDGGYYLIGLNAPLGKLFEGIPWGSASVLIDSLERCRVAGGRVTLLHPLRDVDTVADLQALGFQSP